MKSIASGSGFLISNELRAPHSLASSSTSPPRTRYRSPSSITGREPSRSPAKESSVLGVGLRYQVPDLTVRFDYGWQLLDVFGVLVENRSHVSASYSFGARWKRGLPHAKLPSRKGKNVANLVTGWASAGQSLVPDNFANLVCHRGISAPDPPANSSVEHQPLARRKARHWDSRTVRTIMWSRRQTSRISEGGRASRMAFEVESAPRQGDVPAYFDRLWIRQTSYSQLLDQCRVD